MSLLEVKNLQIYYRRKKEIVRIVEDVHFSLHPRQVLGLTGESGSGKTVIGLAVMKLLEPPLRASGRVEFQGRDLLQTGPDSMRCVRGKEIGMIFQDPMNSFNPLRTIYSHFKDALASHHIETDKTAMLNWLAAVGLPGRKEFLHRYPFQLSGGMLQKLMIAIMLAMRPALLIADEPTGSLDAVTTAEVMRLLLQQKLERNLAAIFISHDLTLMKSLVDQVAVMYAGQMIEYGEAAKILAHPAHPYTRALLESALKLGGKTIIKEMPGQALSAVEKCGGCPFLPRCSYRSAACRLKQYGLQEMGKGHYSSCGEAYYA